MLRSNTSGPFVCLFVSLQLEQFIWKLRMASTFNTSSARCRISEHYVGLLGSFTLITELILPAAAESWGRCWIVWTRKPFTTASLWTASSGFSIHRLPCIMVAHRNGWSATQSTWLPLPLLFILQMLPLKVTHLQKGEQIWNVPLRRHSFRQLFDFCDFFCYPSAFFRWAVRFLHLLSRTILSARFIWLSGLYQPRKLTVASIDVIRTIYDAHYLSRLSAKARLFLRKKMIYVLVAVIFISDSQKRDKENKII